MRISNVHHETAVQSLLLIQEIEPKTWEKISTRINGANTIKHLSKDSFTCPKEYPYMFKSWEDYARHLIENIIQEQKYKDLIYSVIKKDIGIYTDKEINKVFWKTIINTVLSSDWDLTKYRNFTIRQETYSYRNYKKGKPYVYDKYIPK